jgi:hypothetical protein
MWRSLEIDPGLDKLQDLLLGMVPGDEVSVARSVEFSGFDEAQCDEVLDTDARRADVASPAGGYVRCRLDGVRAAR